MDNTLGRIDLNLLVALKILIEERNVTRAANRLFITQPAMSKTLQRLRELFDDPLFTRTAHGLVPTPRAEELREPLSAVLEQIESGIFAREFNPAQAEAEIHITAPEFFSIGGIPMLLQRLQAEAPHLQIQSRNILDDQDEQLANGNIDFSIHLQQNFGPDVTVHKLFTTTPVFWMRQQHPLAGKETLTRKDVSRFPFIALHIPNIHDVEIVTIRERLINSGVEGYPVLRTSQLSTALESLLHSDAILMGPDYLGKFRLTEGHMVSKPMPRGLAGPSLDDFTVPLCLLQHSRTMNSPLHTWLRELMLSLYRD